MWNKKLTTIVLSTIVTGLLIASAWASYTGSISNLDSTWTKYEFKKWMNGWMKWLTDEEKTLVESMTTEERTAFFEAKKAERDAEMEAKQLERKSHEAVIDKLLSWETLTSDEELIRAEIIKKRAERKAEQEAREAKMEEIKTIIEKKEAWETLTEDEQAKLDEMKSEFKGKKWHKGGMKAWERWERGER